MAKKVIKIFFIMLACIFCLPVIGVILLFVVMAFAKAVPDDYTETVETGGDIEARYLAMGPYDVDVIECPADSPMVKYTIFYPKDLERLPSRWPTVLFANGTGILPEKYNSLFEHLASWGFIAVGNDDPSTGTGRSMNRTLDYILAENKNKNSRFYNKIDVGNIGITGHSQGGAGVFNAITDSLYSRLYKTAVSLSPTHAPGAAVLQFPYNLQKVNIPTLMIAGTEGDFETKLVIPIESMDSMYSVLPESKVMARRLGAEHGETQYSADGYVTAWFSWLLKGDSIASKAFFGEDPELQSNPYYQDQHFSLPDTVVSICGFCLKNE